jgi:purine-cytosine permease-like protein
VPLVWLYSLGLLLFLSRGTSDTTALLTSVAAGGIASALALVALTVDETDEPFANVYSAAVSLQNLVPEAPQRVLVLGVGGLSIAGALVIDLGRYQSFLFLLGAFFVPLFGVLAADFLSGSRNPVRIRWSGIAAWLAGVALYQWIQPTGPAWWVDAVERVPGAGEFTGGASLPSFALAFVLFAGLRYAHAPTRRRRARLAGSR